LKKLTGIDTAHGDMQPFIVIPTTSGTGSEAALNAVISDLKSIYQQLLQNFSEYGPTKALVTPGRLSKKR
ncbi:MAG: iron-containing alcohol dehydrogenase, partial [Bacteroidales bacterium]